MTQIANNHLTTHAYTSVSTEVDAAAPSVVLPIFDSSATEAEPAAPNAAFPSSDSAASETEPAVPSAVLPSSDSASTETESAAPSAAFPSSGSASSHESDDAENDEAVLLNGPDRPEGWLTGSLAMLSKVIATSKGAASKPVVRFIKKYMRGTKLVFVVGQSGTGKSTLLCELTGQNSHIGKTHKSGTKAHQVCPAIIDGEQYIFVDTAGFGAADIDDMDNFHDIVTCLDALAPFVTLAGLLFVYGGNQPRMMKADLATIQWVKCFCGPEFYQSITFVTTKWDSLAPDDFEDCWERSLPVLLQEECIEELIDPAPTISLRFHGAELYHHGVRGGKGYELAVDTETLARKRHPEERARTVQTMVRDRCRNTPDVKMQVLREMANGVPWYNTEAAKVLQSNPMLIELRMEDSFLRTFLRKSPVTLKGESMLEAEQAEAPKELSHDANAKKGNPDLAPLANGETRYTLPNRGAFIPKKSWFETLFPWIEVAKEAATFFRQARENRQEGKPTEWSSYWGRFRNWWSGSKPEQEG